MAVDNDEIRWIDPEHFEPNCPQNIVYCSKECRTKGNNKKNIKKILARRGYYRKAVVA